MTLTGKCKDSFEKWYYKYIKQDENKLIPNTDTNYFNLLTDSMKFGLYQDFFDSLGYRIYTREGNMLNFFWESYEYDGDKRQSIKNYNTRKEARTEAIKIANQIFIHKC